MFLKPEEVVSRLPCREGMRVADFGAGAGTYAPLLASRVGVTGAVYAFDIEPMHIECLGRACVERGLRSVFPMRTDLNEYVPLKDATLHAALAVNVLHAIDEKAHFLAEVHRTLRPNGALLLIDWAASFKNTGPLADRCVGPGEAERLLRASGFVRDAVVPAGTHHFAFLARKV